MKVITFSNKLSMTSLMFFKTVILFLLPTSFFITALNQLKLLIPCRNIYHAFHRRTKAFNHPKEACIIQINSSLYEQFIHYILLFNSSIKFQFWNPFFSYLFTYHQDFDLSIRGNVETGDGVWKCKKLSTIKLQYKLNISA